MRKAPIYETRSHRPALKGKGALRSRAALELAPAGLGPSFRDRLAHRAMHLAVAREDLARVKIQRRAVEIGHAAARLGDYQRAGCYVPGPQAKFPERVDPPARDVAEIQRGGARAPHALRAH